MIIMKVCDGNDDNGVDDNVNMVKYDKGKYDYKAEDDDDDDDDDGDSKGIILHPFRQHIDTAHTMTGEHNF